MNQEETANRFPAAGRRDFTLIGYWELVLRRRRTILAATAASLIAAAAWTLLRPSVYVASSAFMLETEKNDLDPRSYWVEKEVRPLSYYQSILQSGWFGQRLADSLSRALPALNGKGEPYEQEKVREIAYEGVSLGTGGYENMIRLTARANDRVLAYTAAGIATDLLKTRSQSVDREELLNAVNFIEQQKAVAIKQLEEVERSLQSFREQSTVSLIKNGVASELESLEGQLAEVQVQKQLSTANLRAFENRIRRYGGAARLQATPESPEASSLRREISDLEARRISLAEGSGERARIDRLLEERKRSLVNLLLENDSSLRDNRSSDDYQALKAAQEGKVSEELNVYVLESRELYIRRRIAEFRARNPDLADKTIEYIRLMRTKQVTENLFNYLLEKGEENKIKAATGTGGLHLVDEPILPARPVPINVMRNLLIGLLYGLGLGAGLALLQEYIDDSIKSGHDITRTLGLPVMGKIPVFDDEMRGKAKALPKKLLKAARTAESPEHEKFRPESRKKSPLITAMSAKSPVMETYRTLRANLQFANVDSKVTTLTVSSPVPSEGKSVTSANLAISFALLGAPVILIDADMRKPCQHKLFKTTLVPGLSDMLVHDLPLERVLRDTTIPSLKVIPAGRIPPNPTELIASQKMTDLCDRIKSQAKVVILDTPPILPISDGVLLGAHTQGVLLVFWHQKTTMSAASEAIDLLRSGGARIIGAVLNGVDFRRMYGQYSSYGKYYQMYYGDDKKKKDKGEE